MTEAKTEARVYRSTQNICAAVGGVVGTAIFIVLAAQGGSGLIPASIFAVLLGLGSWRSAMARIQVVSGGVDVVNLVKARHLAWEDIDRFVAARGAYGYGGHVILRDGRDLLCVGLSTGRLASQRPQIDEPIATLNQLLEARRAGGADAEIARNSNQSPDENFRLGRIICGGGEAFEVAACIALLFLLAWPINVIVALGGGTILTGYNVLLWRSIKRQAIRRAKETPTNRSETQLDCSENESGPSNGL
jgi:hypothetical protein